jgi:hypothetical protein
LSATTSGILVAAVEGANARKLKKAVLRQIDSSFFNNTTKQQISQEQKT